MRISDKDSQGIGLLAIGNPLGGLSDMVVFGGCHDKSGNGGNGGDGGWNIDIDLYCCCCSGGGSGFLIKESEIVL